MGRSSSSTKQHHRAAYTLPSSPTHSSSSSSDFEFTVSISPRKSSPALCPADELFYKGQLLPLQLSPRLSMVRTLLLSSSSSSSSSSTTTSARDSSGSSSDFSSLPSELGGAVGCDSSRPSSVTDQDDNDLKPLHTKPTIPSANKSSYFSLPKLFRKSDPKPRQPKRIISSSAKEVIRKYLNKVKPLYEKLSQNKQQQQIGKRTVPTRTEIARSDDAVVVSSSLCRGGAATDTAGFPQSFSGNLKYSASRTRTCAASSCPSSMRSSPSHSGVLTGGGFPASTRPNRRGTESAIPSFSSSSMEELQSAIQGAIAHCKNSMLQQHNNCNTSSSSAIVEI